MQLRTIATLPAPIETVHPIHQTSRVLVCAGARAFEVDLATSQVSVFAELGARGAGGGGWHDYAFFIDRSGAWHERRGDSSGPVTSRMSAPARSAAAAARARAIACVSYTDAWYRADEVEVFDADTGGSILRYFPPTRDCFEVDAISLSPGGVWLGVTGLEIAYTSDGDWAYGQTERACVVDCRSGAALVGELGETVEPDEHIVRPIALGEDFWIVGAHVITPAAMASDDGVLALSDTHDPQLDYASSAEVVSLLALSGRQYAMLLHPRYGPSKSTWLVCGRFSGSSKTEELDLGRTATALAELEGTLVIGCGDGTLLAADRR